MYSRISVPELYSCLDNVDGMHFVEVVNAEEN